MVAKESISCLLCLLSSVMFMTALPPPALSLRADHFLDSQDYPYLSDDVSGDSYLLSRLLGDQHGEDNAYEPQSKENLSDSDYELPAIDSSSSSRLRALLHKIIATGPSLSSANQESEGVSTTQQLLSYGDHIPMRKVKRFRQEMYGAMPPLNELCRLMKIQCF